MEIGGNARALVFLGLNHHRNELPQPLSFRLRRQQLMRPVRDFFGHANPGSDVPGDSVQLGFIPTHDGDVEVAAVLVATNCRREANAISPFRESFQIEVHDRPVGRYEQIAQRLANHLVGRNPSKIRHPAVRVRDTAVGPDREYQIGRLLAQRAVARFGTCKPSEKAGVRKGQRGMARQRLQGRLVRGVERPAPGLVRHVEIAQCFRTLANGYAE